LLWSWIFFELEKGAEMDARLCRVCQSEIPRARLEAIAETLICVKCSERTGGEFELEVTISGISKAGSLKKTGESVSARRKRKPVQ
jgi:hypothetical protein